MQRAERCIESSFYSLSSLQAVAIMELFLKVSRTVLALLEQRSAQ